MRTRLPLLLLLLPTLSARAADEPARDPMAWPPALRGAVAAAQAASAASAPGGEAPDNSIRQVVFSSGRGYVVVRGRRYGVGEQLDGARIERVTEQAVWLRESGQLRREPLYGGVEKRPPPARAAAGAKNSKEKP
ncbi:hypothetical protein [Roseateles saccharophilus]|uniref:MSHA biogenesis protein MshK n=1 Tax=Roseateles saccharophilus TaxID=304 RepID=A0A4R3URK3_ROSSA|nr:hypothetical protein [Roseateles saccharophilus]MDG0833627.1 hypothetical protein [Roseateles saccharophilus]TCU93213.1 hypothetical protein EV671_101911 [Roseateles saccharophilus]